MYRILTSFKSSLSKYSTLKGKFPTFKSLTGKFGRNNSGSQKLVDEEKYRKAINLVYYTSGTVILMVGLTYAAVPAYRAFCQATSLGGTVGGGSSRKHKDTDKIDTMKVVKNRLIKIRFEADLNSSMSWMFKPLQLEIWVHPGETALAFYSAKNPTKRPIVGISTYNVVPYEAGKYFSKIQCFCFEEQLLNPDEELDLPVFFYIDPDFAESPEMEYVDEITLGYTFFESNQNFEMPAPLSGQNFVMPTSAAQKLNPAVQ